MRSTKEISSNNFSGIKLKVRGIQVLIMFVTNSLLFPWQYYSGEFSVDNNWSYVEIYFKDFKNLISINPLPFLLQKLRV